MVATVRALKMHGGLALDQLGNEDLAALERGLPNLLQHVGNIQDVYSLPVVVAINAFPTDTPAELALVEEKCAELGVNAVLSEHWAKGGAGAIDLANAVVDACGTPSKMTYSYEIEGTSIEDKLDAVARKIYHADGVDFVENAPAQLKLLKEQGFGDLPGLRGQDAVLVQRRSHQAGRATRLPHLGAQPHRVRRCGLHRGANRRHHDDAGPLQGAQRREDRRG